MAMAASSALPAQLAQWFAARGWRVRRHQLEMLAAADAGKHALLVADTGAGKTLAGFLPTLAHFTAERLGGASPPEGLHTLYVSPLKALAHDVQRNLMAPIDEIGLPIRVETRSGDTPSNRKARQRARPPHVLLTTPESLSLLLSYPDAAQLFATLRRVVIDEVHAFATGKRGDLLALSLTRLQALAPEMRRAALSATLADPEQFRAWLAPWGEIETVALVEGEKGAEPEVEILLPEAGLVPWAGHAASWAIPQLYAQIRAHRTTLVFANTRFLAEYLFQLLWNANEEKLPIGIHHGSLSKEARRKVEGAMARGDLRALVCTASLDLGVDWGDIDLVVQMGAPKGSSRLLQRIGRANHRLDCPSKALLVPGNRFEFLEAFAAAEAVDEGQRDGEDFRPGGLDVLAQHVMAVACAGPFREAELLAEVRSSLAYAWLGEEQFARVLDFVATGGYSLRAYDRFRRIVREKDGTWRLAHPERAHQHRMNAGIIVDAEMLEVRFKNGRSLGRVEEMFGAGLKPGDTFRFAGMDLEVEALRESELIVRAAKKSATIPSYMGARMPLTTHLGERVQRLLCRPDGLGAVPRRSARMARSAGLALAPARPGAAAGRKLPARGLRIHRLLHLRGVEREPVARHADHPADGGQGARAARLRRQRLCAGDLGPQTGRGSGDLAIARHSGARIRRLGAAELSAAPRLPRGGGDIRPGRAPAPGPREIWAKVGPAGYFFDRPHL